MKYYNDFQVLRLIDLTACMRLYVHHHWSNIRVVNCTHEVTLVHSADRTERNFSAIVLNTQVRVVLKSYRHAFFEPRDLCVRILGAIVMYVTSDFEPTSDYGVESPRYVYHNGSFLKQSVTGK